MLSSIEPVYGSTDATFSPEGRAVTKLPQPTRDLDRAEDDLFAHGYCIVADVLSPTEVEALRERPEAQARAERDRQIAWARRISLARRTSSVSWADAN